MSNDKNVTPDEIPVLIKGSEFADRVTDVTPQMMSDAATGDEAEAPSEE